MIKWLLGASAFILSGLQAQSIAVTPSNSFVGVGSTLQFSATVTGLAGGVTWSVTGMGINNPKLGSISATGLYTAPAVPPAQNPISVQATGSDGKTIGSTYLMIKPLGPTLTSVSPNPVTVGTYTVTLTGAGFVTGAEVIAADIQLSTTVKSSTTLVATGYQGTTGNAAFKVVNPGTLYSNIVVVPFVAKTSGGAITVSPATAQVTLGTTKQFTASGQTAVTWTASAGSISSSGLYTAPATLPSSNKVTITAAGSNNQSGTATVTLVAAQTGPITVSPATASVALGAMQQFTESGQASVTWTASAGSINSSGLYTAPAVMPGSSTVTITAAGGGQTGTATVTLFAVQPITVSPATAQVTLGATQQFTASGQPSVSWTASAGSINSSGLFTAPGTMPASNTVTITASGTNNQHGTATVTLVNTQLTPTIQSVSASPLPIGIFSIQVMGTNFTNQSVAALNGAALSTVFSSSTVLNVSGAASQSGPGSLTVTNGSQTSAPFSVQVGVANPQVSAAAARRFLEQAAFGPTPGDAAHIQSIGFQAWLNEQFAMAPVSNYSSVTGSQGGLPTQFLANAVMNPDQLRQKVGFALSQIMVISITKLIWNNNVAPYEQMLLNDAFTNYRQILGDVTLSGAMGGYLDMANNAAANPAQGTVANENYSRELMQLFSIGTFMLNPDGSRQKDGLGNFIPTYNQTNVTELARVFTGWTYAQTGGNPYWGANIDGGTTDMTAPMIPFASMHDAGSKTLLSGYVAPAGLSATADLQGALDNLFAHGNVGPFVSMQLIQHLVKSNPSPAYVARVASVFANNGQGVRGDMKAVITAILLDAEARANDNGGNDQSTDGHLQEPALYLPGIVRALGGTMTNQNYFASDLSTMGQDIYNPASVFNYYSPGYFIPDMPVRGPEFQIFTTFTSLYRANLISSVFSNYSGSVQTYGPGMTVDLTPYVALAGTPAALVDALDIALTHGVMPAAMKQIIVTGVQGEAGGNLRRVQTALYLIVASDYYNVWH